MALAIISALSFGDKPNNRIHTTPVAIRRKRKTNSPKSLSDVNRIAPSLLAKFKTSSSAIPGSFRQHTELRDHQAADVQRFANLNFRPLKTSRSSLNRWINHIIP